MTSKWKIAAFAVSLLCVLCFLPVSVAGQDTAVARIGAQEYTTFADALVAVQDTETITLLDNVTIDAAVTINKAITLDLGGKTITATNPGYSSARRLTITAPVTIQNGTLNNTWVSTTKNITMTDVDITIVDDPTHTGATVNPLYLDSGALTVTLTNCNLSLTTARGSASAPLSINWQAKNSTITMNGGSLTMVKNDGIGYAGGAIYTTCDNLDITLNGVDVVYKNNAPSYTALNFGSNGGTLTIIGGTITATNVDGTESRDALKAAFNKTSTVNVDGGAVVNGKIAVYKTGTSVTKINIKDATFNDKALIRVANEEANPAACLVVTGGNFVASAANRAALEAAGVVFEENGTTLMGVDVSARVAKVGDTYYNDLDEALTAANATAGKELVIVGAVETDIVTISGLVIKTEGASAKLTVAVADGTRKEQIANVFNAVTLENASLVELKYGADVVATFGNVTVRNGAIISGAVSENAMAKVGYRYHPSTLNIAEGSGLLLDSTASYGVLGQYKIVKYGAGTKYLVGVELEHDGVAYYRLYEKIDDAILFAANSDDENSQENETIKLFGNITDINNYYAGGGTLYINNAGTSVSYATFTIDLNGYTWSSAYQSDTELVYMLAITANNTNVTIKNGTITGTNAVYGITTNGTYRNTNLTLEDLTLNVPNGSGMYLPATGNVKMTRVNVNAKSVGVQTCAANLTFDNCNITTQGDDRAFEKANGDGLIPDGSAVSIVNRGYGAVPAVAINGGTFTTGTSGVAPIKAYDWNFSGTAGYKNNIAWTPETQPAAITGANVTVSTVGANDGEWVTLVPPVAKIGNVGYATFAEAVAAAKNGETIKLMADVAIDKAEPNGGVNAILIAAGRDITIDLNGYTITKKGPMGNWGEVQTSAFINEGTLTIKDLSTAKTGKIVGGGYEWSVGAVIKNKKCGTLNIEGGRFESGSGTNGMGLSGHYVIFNEGVANISGGEFFSGSNNTALIRNDVSMNITGGTFEQKDFLVLRNAGTTAVMTISGNVLVKQTNDRAVQNYGTVTIEGGEFNGKIQTVSYNDHAATTTISNGTIKGSVYTAKGRSNDYTGVIPTSTVAISGGTFTNPVPAAFCADGKMPEKTADGEYGVKNGTAVAQIGDVCYEELTAAFDAAQNGDTIILLADLENTNFTQQVSLSLKAGVTLNGNGYTISGNVALYVNVAGGVTIKNVTFKNIHNSVSELSPIYASFLAGSLVIDSCTFENWDWDAIQITPTDTAVITITNNEFSHTWTAKAKRAIHIESEENAYQFTTTITGNTFGETNLAYCQFEVYYIGEGASYTFEGNTGVKTACILSSLSANLAHLVAGDAQAMAGNSYDKTFYATLAEAIEAAKNGDIVTLLADVSADVVIPAGKTITLDLAGHTLTNVASHTIVNNGTLTVVDTVGTGIVDNITHDKAALYNVYGGTATLSGGKFTRSAETVDNGSNRYYVIDNRGSMTINSATVTKVTASSNASSLINNVSAGANDEFVAELTINGGAKIESAFIAIKNGSVSRLTINGGEIKSTEKAILNYGKATVKNATVWGLIESCDHCGVPEQTDPYYGDITIESGVFHGNIISTKLNNGTDAIVQIEGGTFYGSIQKEKYVDGTRYKQADDFADARIIISGGTFATAPSAALIRAGYVSVQDGGNYRVLPILSTAQVSIGSDISIKFFANGITVENADRFDLKVTRNAVATTLEPQLATDGSYYFLYTGITPQCMGDEISAELLLDGEVKYTLESYSVKQYLNTIINGDYSEKAKQLAKDMLAYGAAAQVYRDYKTESPVTTDSIRTVTLPTDGTVLINSAEADAPQFTSASLWFDNVNKLRVYFTASEGTNVTATINGENAANIKNCGDGKYMVETDGIYASVFGTQFEIKLLVDGVEKSTLKYSVYDYIAGAQSLSNAKWQNLVKALYAYGESAKAYVASN